LRSTSRTVNTAKSRVVRTNESKFLGFTFKGTQVHWRPNTLRKFKQRIRVLTNLASTARTFDKIAFIRLLHKVCLKPAVFLVREVARQQIGERRGFNE